MSNLSFRLSLFFAIVLLNSALTSNAWEINEQERVIAMELEPDLASGYEIYVLCADCHRSEGWGSIDGLTPSIAGQHRNVLIKQLWDIRQGNRDNQSMFDFLQDPEVSDNQAIADVSAYIADLPMNPEVPPAEYYFNQKLGEELYIRHCQACHLSNGEGNGDWLIPRLQGQHTEYLMRQLLWIKEGKRRNVNSEMMRELDQLSEKQVRDIAGYISEMTPEKDLLAPSSDWVNPDFE